MSDAEGEQRPPALDEFMAELKRLRQQAGNPSFRKLAELSGAVSHATLHLTVTGRRLQPWETVREFVRACGGDEAEWCARYRRTKAVLDGELPGPVAGTTADGGTPETADPDVADPDVAAPDAADRDATAQDVAGPDVASPGAADPELGYSPAATSATAPTDAASAEVAVPQQVTVAKIAGPDGDVSGARVVGAASPASGGFSRRWLAVPLAVLVVVAVVVGLRLSGGEEGRAEAGKAPGAGDGGGPESSALTEPVHEGDASKLSDDFGIQDGAVVAPGQKFTRTFELHNVGSVPWKGRYLQRMDNETGPRHCRAPVRVRIADTPPGAKVKVPVTATAASEPTTCKVHWKMVDATGRQLLPEYRPAFFLVHVRAGASGPTR